jgi:predicted TIM-barrel fold metal-dependent hydrolase
MNPIIDINCQYFKSHADATSVFKQMAEGTDFKAFVVSGMDLKLDYFPDFPFMSTFATSNEQMFQLAQTIASEKLIPFCYIDPTDGDAVKNTEHWICKRGMKGVKMYPPRGWYVDDPRALIVFKAAHDLQVPVFLHMGRTAAHPQLDSRYAQALQLERVGLTCPKLRVIVGHFASPWSREAMDIAMSFPNFYFDLSTSGAWDVELLKETARRSDLGVRRLVYGSNNKGTQSFNTAKALHAQLLAAGFSDADCDAVFFKNACEILNLQG